MDISTLYRLKAVAEQASAQQRDWAKYKRQLESLPEKLGFSSIADLVAALKLVHKDAVTSKPRGSVLKVRKRRTPITPEIREKVKALVLKHQTNAQIATKLGISGASVQNIKTRLGMTRARQEK